MRRRVARRILFLIGVLLLVWAFSSRWFWVMIAAPPWSSVLVNLGTIQVTIQVGDNVPTGWYIPSQSGIDVGSGHILHPVQVFFVRFDIIETPFGGKVVLAYSRLWVLAFICLAWPVTSFIIARRRHKRGFPVEPKPAGGSPPSPNG